MKKPVTSGEVNSDFAFFFSGVRNPFDVSDLVTCMASGHVMQVDKLSADLLPCVVLLATIGLRTYNQQIVDNYELLLQRMEIVIAGEDAEQADALAGGRPMSWPYHPHLYLATFISRRGQFAEFTLDTHQEAGYMFRVYEMLVANDIETLFKEAA